MHFLSRFRPYTWEQNPAIPFYVQKKVVKAHCTQSAF